jgi:DEAD/DEAH box helicase
MRRASNHDPYILEGLLYAPSFRLLEFFLTFRGSRDLLEDRLRAITDAIVACGSDSEDVLASDNPAVVFPLLVASTTPMRTHCPVQDAETSVHETQAIDDNFGEDGTPISSTSHGSTLVSDALDHVPGAEEAVGHIPHTTTTSLTLFSSGAFSSADVEINHSAPTTIHPQASRLPAFAAADESNNLRKTHGPASDDELWNHVDDNIDDDRVEIVSPDANQPTPLFSAVAALRPPPAETPSEASLRASPHYPEVVEKLRNVFHLKAFRKNQLAAIMSTLDGRDAIVLMPTGGGKSLCFQLPAVCKGGKTSGVTVVVSPLRALMADQVERLRDLNINVMMLASMDSQDGNTMHELRSAPSLAYVTPEKLYCNGNMKATLKGLHARQQLARFVIDEAHLINTWGRDFRSAGVRRLVLDILQLANGALLVCCT